MSLSFRIPIPEEVKSMLTGVIRTIAWLSAAIACCGAPPSDDATGVPAEGNLAWERLVDAAPFPKSYNYPVLVRDDGLFVVLQSRGTWTSRDGNEWTLGALPWSGINSAYLSYVQVDGTAWSLGTIDGNYERFSIDPVIRRTSDYEAWETVGRSSSLPRLIFHAAAGFDGALWILGGYDGAEERSEVWRSVDGLSWTRILEKAPWSARVGAEAVVFRGRLYLIGGGRLDGPAANDVWSSADGSEWRLEAGPDAGVEFGGTPVVFRDRIWLVGTNRNGTFASHMIVSDDGANWTGQDAPWSPRGGVAAWTDGTSLFVTGGKYSTVVNGETIFEYSNDVWRYGPPR